MSAKKVVEHKKRINIPALTSLLMIFLVLPLLLIPWHRLFVLRSNTVSTLLIHVIGVLIIGLVTIIFAVLAVVKSRRRQGELRGTWMAWIGMAFGVVEVGIGLFFFIDYLRFLNS